MNVARRERGRAGLALAMLSLLAGCAHRPAALCVSAGTAIVVASHRACLCEGGHAARTFPVAIGRAGPGKTAQGDNRTPTGVYALGKPRPSAKFHTFIPVGYPTADQRARGFTGADIGLHGPPRGWRHLGRATVWFDWTRGCIALPSDAAIDEIAAWVREHPEAHLDVR